MVAREYNELVLELAFSVDRDTIDRKHKDNILTIFGDEESPYVKALKRKCNNVGILTNKPVIYSGTFKYPYVIDIETYRGVFPTTPRFDTDIDHLFTQGTSCVAEACEMVLNTLKRTGENVLIVGRGHAVKGLSEALIAEDFTVTVCHSRTANFYSLLSVADKIVYTAPEWINYTYDVLKKDAVIIDVSGATKEHKYLSGRTITNIGKLTTSVTTNRVARRRNIWL